MFRKLKEFHQKTMAEYQKGLEEEMEPWKKQVMQIHQKASFLFYADEIESRRTVQGECTIRGELVKEKAVPGAMLRILDGEGIEMAKAVLKSSPEGKEEKFTFFAKNKRNEFCVLLTEIRGFSVEDMDEQSYVRLLRILMRGISLIVDEKAVLLDTNECSKKYT